MKSLENDILKKNCAREALKCIKNDSIVGLGGGSTISYLMQYIKESKDVNIKVVTPSFKTKMLCIENGIEVLHTCSVDRIDIAFDGCDQVDKELNALKSGGGIHTKEKLIAAMSDDYILLVDDSKFVDTLTFKYPVVLEILKDSLKYVIKKVVELGGEPYIRKSGAKDGPTVSDGGNLLLDVNFKNVIDIKTLERNLTSINGVIDTSLFVGVVTKVLISSKNGINIISKNN